MTAARPARPLVPGDDDRQALRLRRYLMAAGTSMMIIVLLYVAYLLGGLERAGFVQGAALLIVFLISFLFGVFRLRTRQLLFLALTAARSYGVMVGRCIGSSPRRSNRLTRSLRSMPRDVAQGSLR